MVFSSAVMTSGACEMTMVGTGLRVRPGSGLNVARGLQQADIQSRIGGTTSDCRHRGMTESACEPTLGDAQAAGRRDEGHQARLV